MSEESATPDLVELGRQAVDASNHGDIDPLVGLYARSSVVTTILAIGASLIRQDSDG